MQEAELESERSEGMRTIGAMLSLAFRARLESAKTVSSASSSCSGSEVFFEPACRFDARSGAPWLWL